MTSNPFDSPRAEDPPRDYSPSEEADPHRQRVYHLGAAVLAWEKLRWMFNALVGVAGVTGLGAGFANNGTLQWATFDLPGVLIGICVFGTAANLAYTVGPLLEGYAIWFLGPVPNLRAVVFSLGTLLSVLFTFGVAYFAGMDL